MIKKILKNRTVLLLIIIAFSVLFKSCGFFKVINVGMNSKIQNHSFITSVPINIEKNVVRVTVKFFDTTNKHFTQQNLMFDTHAPFLMVQDSICRQYGTFIADFGFNKDYLRTARK